MSQTSLHIRTEMNTENAAMAFSQNVEIALGLGRLDYPERVPMARNRQVSKVLVG